MTWLIACEFSGSGHAVAVAAKHGAGSRQVTNYGILLDSLGRNTRASVSLHTFGKAEPMTDIQAQFRASFVRRWHTNPDLAQTVDTLAGHGGRVARIILNLWPDASAALLHWALVHDDGESVVGDVPAPAKGATVIHEQELAALDRIWPGLPELTPDEYERLRFADRLDAWMWAKHHAPHVQDSDGWPGCRRWLVEQAEALGVAVTP